MLASTVLLAAVLTVAPPRLDDVMEILRNFEAAAADNRNSRSIINGYNDSAQYVVRRLNAYSDVLTVGLQHFTTPLWTEIEAPTVTILGTNPAITLQACPSDTGRQWYRGVCDYSGVRFGGNASGLVQITARVTAVGFPCTLGGFAGFPAGNVAVITEGTANSNCPVFTMVTNAQAVGASAVFLASQSGAPPNRRSTVYNAATWRPGTLLPSIPTIVITNTVRSILLQSSQAVSVRITSNQVIQVVSTYNVFATTRAGDHQNVLMVGAHLDSVPAGPGINDNGSGSAVILQLCLQLAETLRAQARAGRAFTGNAIRFAWWGAEEIGLVGSYFYVNQLVEHYPDELDRIWGYLNFDMEASGNHVPTIGDASTIPSPPGPTPGSEIIQRLFESAFDSLDLPVYYSSLNGGSDFFPFALAGVPAGGLATGAAGIKTYAEFQDYGGFANAPHDPCYHAPCDTIANLNQQCLVSCGTIAADVVNQVLRDPISRNLTEVRLARVSAEKFHERARQLSTGFAIGCDGDDGSANEESRAYKKSDEL